MIYLITNRELIKYESFDAYSRSKEFKDGQFCFVEEFAAAPDKDPWRQWEHPKFSKKGSEFVVCKGPEGWEYHRVFVPKAYYGPVIKCADKTHVLVQDYFGEVKEGKNFAGHARRDVNPLTILRRIFKISDSASSKSQIEVKGETPISCTSGLKVTGSKDKKADVDATLETRELREICQLNILTIDLSHLGSSEAFEKLGSNEMLKTFYPIDISAYRKGDAFKFVKEEKFVPLISSVIAGLVLDRFAMA